MVIIVDLHTLRSLTASLCLLSTERADDAPRSINTVPHIQAAVPNGTRYCRDRFDTTVHRAINGHRTASTMKQGKQLIVK